MTHVITHYTSTQSNPNINVEEKDFSVNTPTSGVVFPNARFSEADLLLWIAHVRIQAMGYSYGSGLMQMFMQSLVYESKSSSLRFAAGCICFYDPRILNLEPILPLLIIVRVIWNAYVPVNPDLGHFRSNLLVKTDGDNPFLCRNVVINCDKQLGG